MRFIVSRSREAAFFLGWCMLRFHLAGCILFWALQIKEDDEKLERGPRCPRALNT